MFAKKIGIDLGRSSTQVCVRGEGVVVDEPTARIAARIGSSSVFSLMDHLLTETQGRQRLFRPEVMLCIPGHAGSDERRELTQAAIEAGARQAWLIEAPLAAAIGAGLAITQVRAQMVLDLGAGSAQAAVISDSSIVAAETGAAGGEQMDAAIRAYAQSRLGQVLDRAAAEAAKLSLGMARRGALPSDHVWAALQPVLAVMVATLRRALDATPRRLAGQAAQQGVILTGGGAQLPGLDRLLADQTGVPARVAREPRTCAVRGTQRALGELEVVHRRQLYVR